MNNTNQTQLPESMQQRDAQFHSYPDDEISLVDLAKILIKRRWVLLGTAFAILLLSVVFALLIHNTDKMYTYTTIYQQAEKSPGSVLVGTAGLIQQVNTLHWPNYRRQYMQENQIENSSELPFDFVISNPANTTLVTLVSQAFETDKTSVDTLHRVMVEKINQHQSQAIKIETEKLTKQIERTQALLDQVKKAAEQTADPAQALTSTEQIITYTERLFGLQDKLEEIQPGAVIQYTEQGERVQPGKLSSKLVVVLGIILGGILGIMAAFFAEFAARVRQSLKEDQQ